MDPLALTEHFWGFFSRTPYKAESQGKAAQHVKAQGTRATVNGAVAQGKFTLLSGEACFPGGMLFVF